MMQMGMARTREHQPCAGNARDKLTHSITDEVEDHLGSGVVDKKLLEPASGTLD